MSKKSKLSNHTLTAMFIAIILLMDFTPLGYITTGLFSITLMTVPVALGAICSGIAGAAVLSFVFGLTSFLQAFGIGFFIDSSAAILFTEKPLSYTVLCFIPRIAAGIFASLIFKAFEKFDKTGITAKAVSSAVVPITNTVLFMSFYIMLYKDTVLAGKTFMTVFLSAITLNFFIELLATVLISTSVGAAVYKFIKNV